MTDQTNITKETVLVALDIAKKSHDAVIKFPSGKSITMKFTNSLDGYRLLLERCELDQYQVSVGFEPTADYHRTIAYWLTQNGCTCFLISSLSCARAREMLFNSWDKNDRKDARVILYLMQQGIMKPFYDPLIEQTIDIQEISNTYHQISLARTRCMNSLFNHHITLFFPEIERFFNSSRSEWFCRFMLKFPTPGSITRYKQETFIKRAWDVVGRKVEKTRLLSDIYETAKQSIGLPVDIKSQTVESFKLQINRFYTLTVQRSELESLADEYLSSRADYQHLRTIPGVGPIVALIIIAESGDLSRFGHYRQYLNFCGFNLSAHQSGNSKGQYRLSKRGSSRLRYAYWLAATNATRMRENSFREKYHRYISRDPDNKDLCRKGRVAVASKMARVAHALVKSDTDYKGFYEFSRGT
ncbi:MAG: IS110 family transposase [Arenicella sp.]|nr:IS110 family transposase [Arenicella sp.]